MYMKKLLAAFVVGVALATAAPAQAQSTVSPDNIGQPRTATDATPRKKRKASPTDVARMQQRMSMNPDEVKRDQQMEVLEARSGAGGTANTSFGRAAGPARQFEKGSGGFTVRKFKDNRIGTARQKRGQTRRAGYVDPKGKPLNHKKKKGFLFF